MRISKLETLKRQAKNEGWNHWIRSEADERAVLNGCWFCEAQAEYVKTWLETNIILTDGHWNGEPFVLIPYQWSDIVAPIFGWHNAKGFRRYRHAFIEVPKKNGKSGLCSPLSLYFAAGDGEAAGEVYLVATTREQANIIFKPAAEMARRSKIKKQFKIHETEFDRGVKSITHLPSRSTLRILSSDAGAAEGMKPSAIIFDELHAQRHSELASALEYGGIARKQSIEIDITTAGVDRNSVCYERYEYAKGVIDGSIHDDRFLGVIYECPSNEIDQWDKPETWYKANPSLGIILDEDEMRSSAERAKTSPRLYNDFLRYRLNVWVQQENRWIDIGLWKDQPKMRPKQELIGRPCHGYLDLSASRDFTAFALIFPDDEDDEAFDIIARHWIPEDSVNDPRNKQRDKYQAWVRDEWLETTPGNIVDYDFVEEAILEATQIYNVCSIGIDTKFQGISLCVKLQQALDGLVEVLPMATTYSTFGAPMAEFDARLRRNKIRHGNNPILNWAAESMAVKEDRHSGLLLPVKGSSQGKIDGLVCVIGAMAGMMQGIGERNSSSDVYIGAL